MVCNYLFCLADCGFFGPILGGFGLPSRVVLRPQSKCRNTLVGAPRHLKNLILLDGACNLPCQKPFAVPRVHKSCRSRVAASGAMSGACRWDWEKRTLFLATREKKTAFPPFSKVIVLRFVRCSFSKFRVT